MVLLRQETMDKKQLIALTINHLKVSRIELPSSLVLGRLVSQKVNKAVEGFHRSIAESLAPGKRKQLYQLITPKHKEAYAQLAELRTSPQNANSEVMNKYLDYFDQIEQLGILDCNLSAIHPEVITELAQKAT